MLFSYKFKQPLIFVFMFAILFSQISYAGISLSLSTYSGFERIKAKTEIRTLVKKNKLDDALELTQDLIEYDKYFLENQNVRYSPETFTKNLSESYEIGFNIATKLGNVNLSNEYLTAKNKLSFKRKGSLAVANNFIEDNDFRSAAEELELVISDGDEFWGNYYLLGAVLIDESYIEGKEYLLKAFEKFKINKFESSKKESTDFMNALSSFRSSFQLASELSSYFAPNRKMTITSDNKFKRDDYAVLTSGERLLVELLNIVKYENDIKLYRSIIETYNDYIENSKDTLMQDYGQELFFLELAVASSSLNLNQDAINFFRRSIEANEQRIDFQVSNYPPYMLSGAINSRKKILDKYLIFLLNNQDEIKIPVLELLNLIATTKSLQNNISQARRKLIFTQFPESYESLFKIEDKLIRNFLGNKKFSDKDWLRVTNQQIDLDLSIIKKLGSSLSINQFKVNPQLLKTKLESVKLVSIVNLTIENIPNYLAIEVSEKAYRLRLIGSLVEVDSKINQIRSDIIRNDKTTSTAKDDNFVTLLNELFRFPASGNLNKLVLDLEGTFYLFPFEILNINKENYLEYQQISSINKYLNLEPSSQPSKDIIKNGYIIADPDFGGSFSLGNAFNLPQNNRSVEFDKLFANQHYKELPETEIEADIVEDALMDQSTKIHKFLGPDANKNSLKELKNPTYLHVATHGYFLNLSETLTNGPYEAFYYNAMQKVSSGLILSNSTDNNIEYLFELERINLSNNKLTVLSACDTALGTYEVGNGLNSLRKALTIAGSEQNITTIWKIPSRETVSFMAKFYGYIGEKYTVPVAFNKTKEFYLKNNIAPLYWAGFVLTRDY